MFNDTLIFARTELDRYWKAMTGEVVCDIILALYENGNSAFDDEYTVNVVKGKGSIKGCNARSVLFGVYYFFTEMGCRFISPKNERIVSKPSEACTLVKTIKPALRHRGITIEGAVNRENLLDIIDWSCKQGLNTYFIQFTNGYEFYERWYKRTLQQSFSNEEANSIYTEALFQIKKRGLIFHAVGHGWTARCLNMDALGWEKFDKDIDSDTQNLMALVGGKRALIGGIPSNTQLCYSNPEVIKRLSDEVTGYAEANLAIDVLHFWLADSLNNMCECQNCAKEHPTDLYVNILNEIDKKLTAKGLKTKIAFLIYLELLWAPIKAKINNPDRFVMMFAPISRTYARSYADENGLKESNVTPPSFKLNNCTLPQSVKENFALLNEWRKSFGGDSFSFEYHLMWDIHKDFGQMNLAKVLYKDIIWLKEFGMGGMINCQLQRAFFPSALCMYIYARTATDNSQSYESLEDDFFKTCFAEYALQFKEVLEKLSNPELFRYLRFETPMLSETTAVLFEKTVCLLKEALSLCSAAESSDAFVTRNIEMIKMQTELSIKLYGLFAKKARGTETEEILKEYRSDIKPTLSAIRESFQTEFDDYYFNVTMENLINYKW